MKQCGKCGETKPIKDFHKSGRNKSGYRGLCKSCEKNRNRIWNLKNPNASQKHRRKYRYNHCINYKELEERFEDTTNCECCGVVFGDNKQQKKCVDHYGNVIRGIICGKCNTGLGMFGDNMVGIINAYNYMKERHNEPS
jgi:hypothetical protein